MRRRLAASGWSAWVVAHFPRRVLPSSCLSPRRPIAKMKSRPRPWCGGVGRGGGGWGGVGWLRTASRRAFEVGARFSHQVLVQTRTHFPLVDPGGHKTCAKSAAGGFLSSSCLRGAAALARFSCLLFAGNRSGPVPSSWPRVLTSAPCRPSLAQGRRGTRSPQEAIRFQPRVVKTSERSPPLFKRRFEKPSRTNQLRTTAPPDAASSQFYRRKRLQVF